MPGPGRADEAPARVALVGIPFDANSSFLRGAARAPAHIRKALFSPARNLSAEAGLDLGTTAGWEDRGDLALAPARDPFDQIEEELAALLSRGKRVLALGGDHSITLPLVRAYARRHPGLTLLQLDAHPDLYDELDGNRLSHGCPFARIMEEGLVERLVQVGIRAATPHQRDQAERFGVETIRPDDSSSVLSLELAGPLYLSVDLDCLDPAFAPGVAHPEPGGLTTRNVLTIVQRAVGPIVGADLVELNPLRDPLGLTAVVAAKLAREILARMLVDGDTAEPRAESG